MSLASEVPFHTQTRAAFETGCRSEVIAQFYFRAHVQIVAPQVPANVVPQLWLRNEDCVLFCA